VNLRFLCPQIEPFWEQKAIPGTVGEYAQRNATVGN
jgi:hypothetical protein